VLSDGGVGIVPEGFSYGPAILEVVPNGATAEGGQTGAIIGYGFGDSTSGVQVTVGGQAAPVTAVNNYPGYPVPVNSLQFIIPPGTAGSAVDVAVTTLSGSSTAAGAFHYTAAVESYPVTANLQSGIYDAGRDLYFFADQSEIQVLSKSMGKWLSPIPLPGVTSGTQLLAISESPDGTKLAVSDYGGQAIFVLDPDTPASAKRYPMSLDNDGGFAPDYAPSGLAVADNGMVYFVTADINGTGSPLFHVLNTSAESITDIGDLQSAGGEQFEHVLTSSDGSKVYSSQAGDVTNSFWLDTSNNQITFPFSNYLSAEFDLAISGDGSTLDAAGGLTDSLLNPETQVAYIDWETWFPTAVTGQKLNQDGSVMFQPLTDGIDMLARNTGRLLYRIQIPFTPANVFDALVVAEGENTLAVIAPTGVSFVDLSSLPIAPAYMQPFANGRHSRTAAAHRHLLTRARRDSSERPKYWTGPELKHSSDESLPSVRVR
jgi:IPT/TIG domain